MEQNIVELAKKLAALSPRDGSVALKLIRAHGYLPGERTSAIIDLAKALISVWDGKASTLDQAAAWQSVWAYCATNGLVRGSLTSNVEEVLTALDDLRGRKSIHEDRASAWLTIWDYVRETGMLPKDSCRSPVQQVLGVLGDYRRIRAGAAPLNARCDVSIDGIELTTIEPTESMADASKRAAEEGWPTPSEFDKDILEIKTSCAAVMAEAPKAFTHCESSALIDKLASAVFNLALTVQKSHREFVTFAAPVRIINNGCTTETAALIKAHNKLASYGAPAQEVAYDPANAKPCHLSHELYKTGDADAPEQVKDRNGEVVLDQCRHCGRAESQLLDGKPCAVEPANDNSPDPLTDPAAIRRWKEAVDKLADVVEPARLDVVKRLLVLQDTCYGLANNAGWWTDLETGEDVRNWPNKHLDNWVSAKLMLIVTEVAEAMEGHRKGLKDDKLPHRGMLEVELADAVIRIMDLAGGLNMDVAGAIVEKLAYNMSREDHKIENRKAAGGKSV